MTFDVDRLQRRGLAVAATVLLIVLSVELLIVPVVDYFTSAQEEREHSLHQLAKLQALVNAEPGMQQALGTIDTHPFWQHVYPNGGAAALQQDFRSLADGERITIDSVQPIDPASVGDFQKLGVRVGFSTTTDHLSHLLLAMRASPHALRFENFYVTSPTDQSASENPKLMVRGDVVGLARPDKQP